MITTIAGTGVAGFAGDAGPASAARLAVGEMPDVVALPDGGLLFADTGNDRVRRIRPDGTITTVAGSGESERRDGSPADRSRLDAPKGLAPTVDHGFLVAESEGSRISKVDADGMIHTFAQAEAPHDVTTTAAGGVIVSDDRGASEFDADGTLVRHNVVPQVMDFAGRTPSCPEALALMPDGGLTLTSGCDGRVYYVVSPSGTERTLSALRNAKIRPDGVDVTVETTVEAGLEVTVLRRGIARGRTVVHSHAGLKELHVDAPLTSANYVMRARATGPGGAIATDRIAFYGGMRLKRYFVRRRLAMQTWSDAGGGYCVGRCKRWGRRRIDCEFRLAVLDPNIQEVLSDTCGGITAVTLWTSGTAFSNGYRCRPHLRRPFRRHPHWTETDVRFPRH